MNNATFEDLALPELLKLRAREFASHTAVRCDGRRTDFATFDAVTDRIAAALAARGVVAGDRVALYCPNSDAFALSYFGIIKAGAAVVPVNLLLNPKEVAWILADAGVRAIVYHEAFAEAVETVRGAVSTLQFSVRIGTSTAGDVSWKTLLQCSEAPPRIAADPARDVAVILYTSGTTGKPKGAMLSHRNLAANTWGAMQAMRLQTGRDVILVVLPMFHAFAATVGMLIPLLRGCSFVTLPRFDPELVADTIEQTGVTVLPLVPSMYSVLMRLPASSAPKLKSIRFCVSGGAAMPADLMRRFEERFGKTIYEGDGPTECSPVTCVNPPGGLRKPGSVGPPIPGVEMSIRSDDGSDLPDGEIGEICVRGPSIMLGYWNQPEATAEAFFEDWFRTGDLGHRDGDGYFYIVDRKKDLVIVNGMNVYPRIVEEAIYQHPAVAEAAVIGEPNELHGEIPVAFVSLREHTDATALRTWCRDHLGRHEVPRKFFIMDELPKNAAGKILKRELRKHGELERGVDSREDG
jgi:long-chain acyl-CoA synthetase